MEYVNTIVTDQMETRKTSQVTLLNDRIQVKVKPPKKVTKFQP